MIYSKNNTIILLLGLFVFHNNPLPCQSFTIDSNNKIPLLYSSGLPSSIKTKTRSTSSLLSSSSHAVYDGSEWRSVQELLHRENILSSSTSSSQGGKMDVLVGTNENKRVVGISAATANGDLSVVALDNGDSIYFDSMAEIPNSVSDQDAISTLVASLPSIHCSLPSIDGVGGDETKGRSTMTVSGKVVVVGGNDYACFAADGLALLGSNVSLVTTGNPKIQNKNDVNILAPAVDNNDNEDDRGFCSAVGQFDTLLDTVGDERPKQNSKVLYRREDTKSIIALLRNQHNCKRYVSTITEAQSIVLDSGVLFGPGKADKHVKQIQQQSNQKQFQDVLPPKYFGTTVQTLLENGIIYGGYKKDSTIVRGWSLSEFWEKSTWPVDSETGNRFGFPVKENGMSDDEKFKLLKQRLVSSSALKEQQGGEEGQEQPQQQEQAQKQPKVEKDPYVKNVFGIEGLLNNVVYPEADCVVFLSAQWCRTCKKLSPAFSRMARETTTAATKNNNDLFFVKADTSGILGKQLGKYLEVEAVPAFILFRKGKRYGKVISLSKLPSEKLDVALNLLESGKDWDSDAMLQAEK